MHAEIFSSPTSFPKASFSLSWLPLKGSNEVGNVHAPPDVEGVQSRTDAGYPEKESLKQEQYLEGV